MQRWYAFFIFLCIGMEYKTVMTKGMNRWTNGCWNITVFDVEDQWTYRSSWSESAVFIAIMYHGWNTFMQNDFYESILHFISCWEIGGIGGLLQRGHIIWMSTVMLWNTLDTFLDGRKWWTSIIRWILWIGMLDTIILPFLYVSWMTETGPMIVSWMMLGTSLIRFTLQTASMIDHIGRFIDVLFTSKNRILGR